MKTPASSASEPATTLAGTTAETGFVPVQGPSPDRVGSETFAVVTAACIFWTVILVLVLGVRRRQNKLEQRLGALETPPPAK
jgi:hypothetical protein